MAALTAEHAATRKQLDAFEVAQERSRQENERLLEAHDRSKVGITLPTANVLTRMPLSFLAGRLLNDSSRYSEQLQSDNAHGEHPQSLKALTHRRRLDVRSQDHSSTCRARSPSWPTSWPPQTPGTPP